MTASISFAKSKYVEHVGRPIPPIAPTVNRAGGFTPDQWTTWPLLPDGLVIDPTNGMIRGTPASTDSGRNYAVTATDTYRNISKRADFFLTILRGMGATNEPSSTPAPAPGGLPTTTTVPPGPIPPGGGFTYPYPVPTGSGAAAPADPGWASVERILIGVIVVLVAALVCATIVILWKVSTTAKPAAEVSQVRKIKGNKKGAGN